MQSGQAALLVNPLKQLAHTAVLHRQSAVK